MPIPGKGPFRWRWGKMARMLAASGAGGGMARGLSRGPAGLLGRGPVLALIGSLVLHDLSRPNSRIRQLVHNLTGPRAITGRTVRVIEPGPEDAPIDVEVIESSPEEKR